MKSNVLIIELSYLTQYMNGMKITHCPTLGQLGAGHTRFLQAVLERPRLPGVPVALKATVTGNAKWCF